MVEVDASKSGMGAILSQCFREKPKLHPIAFFSWKLSSGEWNYNIGNRKLLPVKHALEEWRHWLESAAYPFTILTDHKNLEYLHITKCLNRCQAHWSLFFTHFNLNLSYCPSSRNTKADSLSCIHPVEEPDLTLNPSYLHPVLWTLSHWTLIGKLPTCPHTTFRQHVSPVSPMCLPGSEESSSHGPTPH